MTLPSNRLLFAFVVLAAIGLIGMALYLQHIEGLYPCYLCITQRVFIMAYGAIAAIALIHNPITATGNRVYASLIALLTIGGGFFSAKQLWLQGLPEDQVPACGLPADVVFDYMNTFDALAMFFKGDGNCAEVQWTMLGLSIPGWALISFIGIFLVALLIAFRKH